MLLMFTIGLEKDCILEFKSMAKSDDVQTLVVDLDGTLIFSDMLFESFWLALSNNWRVLIGAVFALLKGRAQLKEYLAHASVTDVQHLPYNETVLLFIQEWRLSGKRVALVTASDQKIAHEIGNHLGIFDEVWGSNGKVNLRGERKSRFLEESYRTNGYYYMGDAMADLPVWRHAAKALTVNATAKTRRAVELVNEHVEHLNPRERKLTPYMLACRPYQWIKNILTFLPIVMAHQFGSETLLKGLTAFASFCLIASSVYILNDLFDLKADRRHPRKKRRPFASGDVPIAHGMFMLTGLLLLGLFIAAMINLDFLLVVFGYYCLTTAYSIHLKQQVIIDIFVLAMLYTVRIIGGGTAVNIDLSVWLLAFSVFIFLSLAAVKRQAELKDNAVRGKEVAVGRGYSINDLSVISMIAITSGYLSVLVMILYISSPNIVSISAHPEVLWGISAVLLYWITRTIMISHRGNMTDDPIIYAFKDRISQICMLTISVLFIWGSFL